MKNIYARMLLRATRPEIITKVRIDAAKTLYSANETAALLHGALPSEILNLGKHEFLEEYCLSSYDDIENLNTINNF